jgi:type IV pilus biogenesis protein CpaD/CtpE
MWFFKNKKIEYEVSQLRGIFNGLKGRIEMVEKDRRPIEVVEYNPNMDIVLLKTAGRIPAAAQETIRVSFADALRNADCNAVLLEDGLDVVILKGAKGKANEERL